MLFQHTCIYGCILSSFILHVYERLKIEKQIFLHHMFYLYQLGRKANPGYLIYEETLKVMFL